MTTILLLGVLAGQRAPALGVRGEGKVVLVAFAASWCTPCRKEIPELEKLHRRYHDRGFRLVVVAIDGEPGDARRFLAGLGLTAEVVLDPKGETVARFGPPKMPTSYLIDRAGVVRRVQAGYAPGALSALEQAIRKLL